MSTGRVSLHVDTGTGWGGGQDRVLALLTALRAAGETPCLVAPPDTPLLARARALHLDTHALRMRGDIHPHASWTLARLAMRATLLHAHTAHAHALLLPVATLTRRPLVVTRRNLARPHTDRAWTRPLDRLFTRLKYSAARAVLCVSEAVADDVRRLGVDPARISLAPTPVRLPDPPDPRHVARLRARCAPGGGPLLAALGALEPVKNHAALVRAAAALRSQWPSVAVAIGGDGSQRAALLAVAEDLGLGARLHLLGHLDDPRALLAACDVFVHPSRSEGAPGAILDALAQARPVVATAVGGVGDIIQPSGVAPVALLVPAEDDAALAAACARLLADPVAAAELGTRAREHVLAHFPIERMVAATRAAYDRVVPAR